MQVRYVAHAPARSGPGKLLPAPTSLQVQQPGRSRGVAPRDEPLPCSRRRHVARVLARLHQQTRVVTARPVLDDDARGDAPEVDEGPRHRLAGRFSAAEQRHGRRTVGAVQGQVLRDQVAVADEVVLLERDRTEVDVDGAQGCRAGPRDPEDRRRG